MLPGGSNTVQPLSLLHVGAGQSVPFTTSRTAPEVDVDVGP
ncbi:hypothetical protein AAW51_1449 [Caldimonas brevitalea]|uniref:Uncharacterized protein n=1 Tax=Caldimonas brevitalea TaxID=413882 RepID=A0A0G3BNL6_9BURK|nr:hypothetical protein AAW51_1449 [Caldimonas brevitalea]